MDCENLTCSFLWKRIKKFNLERDNGANYRKDQGKNLLNLEHLVVLLAGPISHASTHLLFILLILVGVELPSCIVVTLP